MSLKSILLPLSLLAFTGAANAGTMIYDGTDHVYFEYINTNENWDKANSDAQTAIYNGKLGELAVITNANENSLIASLIQSNGGSSAWLGATNTVNGNQEDWTWLNGTTFNCTIGNSASCTNNIYTNFNPGEPNNYGGNENALQIYSGGTWNDLNKNNPGYDNPGYIVEFTGSTIQAASQTVPEPASIFLLMAGMLGIAASGRQQRLSLASAR